MLIGDSGDAGLITDAIWDASLCLECIAEKTCIVLGQVEAVLSRMRKFVLIASGEAPCDACLTVANVSRLA